MATLPSSDLPICAAIRVLRVACRCRRCYARIASVVIAFGGSRTNRQTLMDAATTQIVAMLALGAACGLAGGLFGVGGGVIVIPLLGMLFALDQQTAQGTALVMVVPN